MTCRQWPLGASGFWGFVSAIPDMRDFYARRLLAELAADPNALLAKEALFRRIDALASAIQAHAALDATVWCRWIDLRTILHPLMRCSQRFPSAVEELKDFVSLRSRVRAFDFRPSSPRPLYAAGGGVYWNYSVVRCFCCSKSAAAVCLGVLPKHC